MIETKTQNGQFRARGLYDEQLQRQQQEKKVGAERPAEDGAAFFQDSPAPHSR